MQSLNAAPIEFASTNGDNADFSFRVASLSKSRITVVNYRIRTSSPWALYECEVRTGLKQNMTAFTSYTYGTFEHRFFTTKTVHPQEIHLYQRRRMGFFHDSSSHWINSTRRNVKFVSQINMKWISNLKKLPSWCCKSSLACQCPCHWSVITFLPIFVG